MRISFAYQQELHHNHTFGWSWGRHLQPKLRDYFDIVDTCNKDAGRAQWSAAQNLSPEKLTVIHSSGTIGLLARARNKLNKFRHPVGNPAYFGAPKSSTASLTQHFACPAAGDSFHDMASIMKIMIYTVTDMWHTWRSNDRWSHSFRHEVEPRPQGDRQQSVIGSCKGHTQNRRLRYCGFINLCLSLDHPWYFACSAGCSDSEMAVHTAEQLWPDWQAAEWYRPTLGMERTQ